MKFVIKNKNLLVLIILFLLLSQFINISSNVRAFTNVHWFTVKVSPSYAGVNASYDISGGISNFNGIDKIIIYLEWTKFKYSKPSPSTIIVNGVPATLVLMQSVPDRGTSRKNLKITIKLGKVINKNDELDIKINKNAGITNPSDPRPCYRASIYLYKGEIQEEYIGSEQYAITQSVISSPIVSVEQPIENLNSAYTINFFTGVNGSLHANKDDIRIRFPQGTYIPTSYFPGGIYINDVECISGIYRDSDNINILRIFIPINIKPNSPVKIVIKKKFGIINTNKIGENFIYVSTYQEPEWIKSKPFTIAVPKVQSLVVTTSSNAVGNNVSLDVYFKTSIVGLLNKGQHIYIVFPASFNIVSSGDRNTVQVNGVESPFVIEDKVLAVTVQSFIDSNSNVSVHIPNSAGIYNPNKKGVYPISLYTDSDSYVSTFNVRITSLPLSEVTFAPSSYSVGINSAYTITFKTGLPGALKNHKDYICISFDKSFSLPSQIEGSNVLINGKSVNTVSVDVYSHIVKSFVPMDIGNEETVKIVFQKNAGIRNPVKAGEYKISICTSKERESVKSNAVEIIPLPVVEFSISPEKPDGGNGYYMESPTLSLSTPNGKEIYYKKGTDKEFVLYKLPISNFSDGIHTIYAYAVDKYGNNGKIQKKVIKVDLNPPTVTFDQGNGNLYVNSTTPTLSGKVSKLCSVLQINGVNAVVNKDHTFTVSINISGSNSISVYARDLAGRSASFVRRIYLDTVPPIITLISPTDEYTTTGEEDFVIRFKTNEKCSAEVNNSEITSSDNNVFEYKTKLSDGDNVFDIIVIDLAENKATKHIVVRKVDKVIVTLHIGSKEAFMNRSLITLDVEPIIVNGSTLVPLRFISDVFGAEVDWNAALKVITMHYDDKVIQLQIDSKIVTVDGTIEKLDVPPIIKNNRTLVPLRFISQAFGAKVQWDGKTKTITLIYTP